MKRVRNAKTVGPNGNATWWMWRRTGNCEHSTFVTYYPTDDRAAAARSILLARARLRRDTNAQRKAMLR